MTTLFSGVLHRPCRRAPLPRPPLYVLDLRVLLRGGEQASQYGSNMRMKRRVSTATQVNTDGNVAYSDEAYRMVA